MLALGAGLLVVLLSQVSLSELASTLRQIRPGYLMLALLITVAITLIRTLRFGLFFRPALRPVASSCFSLPQRCD